MLKNLSPERQAEVYARCNLPADQGGGYTATRKWLADDGIKTSEAALSEFWSWYGLSQQLKRNESTVETLLKRYREINQNATAEELMQAGQAFFSALALEQQDAKTWYLTQQVGLKKEQLTLDRKKFQRDTCELFIKWYADEEAKKIMSSNMPTAEKTERLGQRMFGELWK